MVSNRCFFSVFHIPQIGPFVYSSICDQPDLINFSMCKLMTKITDLLRTFYKFSNRMCGTDWMYTLNANFLIHIYFVFGEADRNFGSFHWYFANRNQYFIPLITYYYFNLYLSSHYWNWNSCGGFCFNWIEACFLHFLPLNFIFMYVCVSRDKKCTRWEKLACFVFMLPLLEDSSFCLGI